MKRLVRPAVFTALSVAALVTFVWAARWSVDPLDWRQPGAWLDRVDPVDAVVEVARWVGIVLSAYVGVVSLTALVAELSFAVRMPRLGRRLRTLAGVVAFPALRRRLLEVTTAVTITASSINASPALATAPAVATAAVDAPMPLTAPIRGSFEGFGTVALPAVDDAAVVAPTYAVQAGDTLWQIVERHYGWVDAHLVRQVAAVSQLEDGNRIWPGDVVTFPATTDPPPTVVHGEATWAAVTVNPGDTLWAIVERHYGEAHAEVVWQVVDANPAITDPGLILPGQVITLPPMDGEATEPAPQVVETPAEAEAVAPPTTSVAEEPPTTTPPAVIEAELPTTVIERSAPTTSAAPPPTTSAAPVVAVDSIDFQQGESGGLDDDPARASVASIVGWTGGAGLAAALIGLAARRRRRLPIRKRHAPPTADGMKFAIALRETQNLNLVDFAANALRAAAQRLSARSGEPTPVPRLLRLGGDEVELVWDTPNANLISPWSTPDGGWSWTLRNDTAITNDDGPAPCPGLVTIGLQNDADVLLNLESCGSLSITGDQDAAEALARSIATEFAGSVFADSPTILTIGLASLAAEPEHARQVDVTEALGWLRDRTESAGALLAHRRLTSLFALRARSKPNDAHEPVVVLVAQQAVAGEELTQLVDLANGDLGAVVIVLGEHPSVTWRLLCSGYDVTVEPLGLTLDAVALPESIDELVEEYIPEPDLGVDEFADGEDAPAEYVLTELVDLARLHHSTPVSGTGPVTGDVEAALGADDGWDVELKVMGQVRCIGSKLPLRPSELHFAILMAFHPGGMNSDTIVTYLWPNGCPEKTLTNLMASLRRKLGTDSTGQPLFPKGRDHNYTYHLSPRVTTDWNRFLALLRRAESLPDEEALPLLDEALALVDGPPFQAPRGYSWAYDNGTATLIAETIKATARRSAELHLAQGRRAEAASAACAALTAIGAPPLDLDQLI